MGREPRYRITYQPTRQFFYRVPAASTVVRGDQARKVTCQAIREAGGRILKVRQLLW